MRFYIEENRACASTGSRQSHPASPRGIIQGYGQSVIFCTAYPLWVAWKLEPFPLVSPFWLWVNTVSANHCTTVPALCDTVLTEIFGILVKPCLDEVGLTWVAGIMCFLPLRYQLQISVCNIYGWFVQDKKWRYKWQKRSSAAHKDIQLDMVVKRRAQFQFGVKSAFKNSSKRECMTSLSRTAYFKRLACNIPLLRWRLDTGQKAASALTV